MRMNKSNGNQGLREVHQIHFCISMKEDKK